MLECEFFLTSRNCVSVANWPSSLYPQLKSVHEKMKEEGGGRREEGGGREEGGREEQEGGRAGYTSFARIMICTQPQATSTTRTGSDAS
jgi:hypothetical protein